MKRLMSVTATFVVIVLTGCGGGNGYGRWDIAEPTRTGIVPTLGDYDFKMARVVAPNLFVEFSVVERDGKKVLDLYHDRVLNGWREGLTAHIPIENGGAIIHNGGIAPGLGHFPYEGFAISVSFVTPVKAVGEIQFATYGHSLGKTTFVATLKPPG